MEFKSILLVSICAFQISLGQHFNREGRELDYEAYQLADNPEVVILKISPHGLVSKPRVGRQEDEDEDEVNTTPYIPAIIPGVTKIFNGLLTGNLNEIFHGSTSFAPKQTANAINTVYNQVVGLPPPTERPRATTVNPLGANATVNGTAPVVAAAATVATTSTASPDDEDEDNESDLDYKNQGERQ